MTLGYIGNFEPEFSTENDYRKAFEYLGHEVIQLQENKIRIMDIYDSKPDLLLITSTWDEALDLSDMLRLFHFFAKQGIPTATVHLDTFWPTSRGNRKWWLNPMFHTAYIFTADGDWQREWELLGKNHIWLPPAVRHDAVGMGTFRQDYACDVAFVGSNGVGYHEDVWPYRKTLVDNLRHMCQKNGWIFRNPGGDDPKIERDHNMNDFYASAKITVGDSLCVKRENARYWSDRVAEATGRGGFLIMPKINNLIGYHNVPMYEWGDFSQLERYISHYLDNEDERNQIVKAELKNTADNHTYVNRAKTILETIFHDRNG